MKFKKLGNTDLDVSLICLRTMTRGTQNSEKEAFEQMDYSIDQGVNFFDTAELYSVPPTAESYGKTEGMIGNWWGSPNFGFSQGISGLLVTFEFFLIPSVAPVADREGRRRSGQNFN